jgi:hypothetical protein
MQFVKSMMIIVAKPIIISLPTFLEASAVCNTCSARAVPFAHMDTSLVVTVFEAEAFVLLAFLYTSRLEGEGNKDLRTMHSP